MREPAGTVEYSEEPIRLARQSGVAEVITVTYEV